MYFQLTCDMPSVAGHDLPQTFRFSTPSARHILELGKLESSVASAAGLNDFFYNLELQLRSSSSDPHSFGSVLGCNLGS